MAVYTHLSESQLHSLLADYNIGELQQLTPIAEGVENSNYILDTSKDRFILTIYEKRVEAKDLPFFLKLKQHLADRAIPCPLPIARKDGALLSEIAGKPAAIISFLAGKSLKRFQNTHIGELGTSIAQMHLAAEDIGLSRKNTLSPDQLMPLYEKTKDSLDSLAHGLVAQLADEMQAMQQWPTLGLPRGIIHADLFPDNVFFNQDHLSGLIDFYFACEDYLAYDLAIAFNAWCFESNVDFNITKAQHLISHYHRIRPLSEAELDALPLLARGAALRFFFTRAHDWFFPVEGAVVTPKDPVEYLKKWEFHCGAESFRDYIL
jgi:homoserine kinase type II